MSDTLKDESYEAIDNEPQTELPSSENTAKETVISEEANILPVEPARSQQSGQLVPFEPKRLKLTEPDAINLGRQLARTVPSPVGVTVDDDNWALHGALALYAEQKPRDAHESMLARLAVATTNVAMETISRAALSAGVPGTHEKYLRLANQSSLTTIKLLDAIDRHRGQQQQNVSVHAVNVHSGAQAIVGNVNKPAGADDAPKPKDPSKRDRDDGDEG